MARSVAVLVVAGFLISGAAYAASDTAASSTEQKKTVVDVGNKLCPVTGEPVDGKTFYEYNGKRYGFCCPMCPPIFAGNPEKYSAIAEKDAAGKK